MASYLSAAGAEFKNGKKAVLVIIFTIARIIYGWEWLKDGYEKLPWLTNGKDNSAGLITKMIGNLAGPKVTRFDPLHINNLFAWIAQNVFLSIPRVTDILVVVLELLIGLALILGFRIFWFALIATFLNIQYIAAGSFNNFGYIWTNLALMKFARSSELIGIDGYIRYKRGKTLI